MENEPVKFKTYIEVAESLIAEYPDFYNAEAKDGMLSYAKYLDSFKSLGNELQLLAMQQSRKIDHEIIMECVKVFGEKEVTDVVRIVTLRHRHTKI
jgi:hypothetical protein